MTKGPKDPDFYEEPTNSIGYLSRITFRAFARALEKRTLTRGVTIGQWRFLRVLWTEDGLTQRELSRRVGLREPTTVTALKSLERSELVTRKQSEEDRRRVHVFLTAKAKRLRRTLMPFVADVNRVATAGVSDAELELLRGIMLRINANLIAHNGETAAAEDESAP
jgi:DNA-binding MarR family transcriptional regulator